MPADLPNPLQLAEQFERGVINRRQFQAAMSLHAGEIIDEMIEVSRNPLAAYFEELRNRRVARKLVKKHSEAEIRRALITLSRAENFPPGRFLWNAAHWEIPLHCFLRTARPPVFRIVRFGTRDGLRHLVVEYSTGGTNARRRDAFHLARDDRGGYVIAGRQSVARH